MTSVSTLQNGTLLRESGFLLDTTSETNNDCSNIIFNFCEIDVKAEAVLADFTTEPGKDLSLADAVTEFDLSYLLFRSAYEVCADSIDISDGESSDFGYRVKTSGIGGLIGAVQAKLDTLHDLDVITDDLNNNQYSVDNSANYQNNITVGHHYVRYLANKMFGNKELADIFNNEQAVRESINDASNNNAGNGTAYNLSDDAIAEKTFKNMMKYDEACRLTDMSGTWLSDNGSATRFCADVPFLPGDKVVFMLTVCSNSGQESYANPSIPDYKFRVIINLKQ